MSKDKETRIVRDGVVEDGPKATVPAAKPAHDFGRDGASIAYTNLQRTGLPTQSDINRALDLSIRDMVRRDVPAFSERGMTDKPKTYEELLATPPPFSPRRKPEPKPKVLAVEVPERTFETAKAKPDKIRILTEDEHGNRVIGAAPIPRERPYRPRAEEPIPVDNGGRAAVGAMKWGRAPWPGGIPTPRWSAEPRGYELVRRNYDIFAVLREDD